MSTNSLLMAASATKVWDVLADGWLYPLFVVGASRMRQVDDDWPAVGARLHHSVGSWPALLDDETESLALRPGQYLELRARGWPAGEADVAISLEPLGDQTRVTIVEDVVSGAGLLVPKALRDVQLYWRNTETLRRLAYVVRGR